MTNQTSLNFVTNNSDLDVAEAKESINNSIAMAFNNVSLGILYITIKGDLLCYNDTLKEFLSMDKKADSLKTFEQLFTFVRRKITNHQIFLQLFSLPFKAYLKPQTVVAEMRDGRVLYCVSKGIIKDGLVEGIVWSFNDITEHKAQERTAIYKSLHDSLTQLPNRECLYKKLEDLLLLEKSSNKGLAVLFLDIDDFKLINDTYGHDSGDQLLVSLVGRLRNALRVPDTLGRLSGDEFIIILDETQSEAAVLNVVERIRHSLLDDFKLSNASVNVSLSIGISFFPSTGTRARQLIRHADFAMYQAKRKGKNNFCFYDSTMES